MNIKNLLLSLLSINMQFTHGMEGDIKLVKEKLKLVESIYQKCIQQNKNIPYIDEVLIAFMVPTSNLMIQMQLCVDKFSIRVLHFVLSNIPKVNFIIQNKTLQKNTQVQLLQLKATILERMAYIINNKAIMLTSSDYLCVFEYSVIEINTYLHKDRHHTTCLDTDTLEMETSYKDMLLKTFFDNVIESQENFTFTQDEIMFFKKPIASLISALPDKILQDNQSKIITLLTNVCKQADTYIDTSDFRKNEEITYYKSTTAMLLSIPYNKNFVQ